ncbi:MAG TPA: hypothetical protein VLJ39_15545, partial [Tepidisphaeraceae bacterium]|nr:hypothetical protein [Tepidisphaeraceae bacterium]
TPVFHAMGRDAAFWCLSIGTTVFSIGCGAAEGAINPMVAALYPGHRTGRLNALHAGFPGGLVLGALFGVLLQGMRWEAILLTYLVPTVLYGVMILGQTFPHSQARIHHIPMKAMAREFASPVLIALLVLMAMVGFVELGTDSWIANITGNLLADPKKGLYLFIWTSMLMFVLRFCAGPILHRISPLGLLFCASCLGGTGLLLLSHAGAGFSIGGAVVAATIAATIYGSGKTFYWGTMLGVTAERFPRGGALVLGAIGCVGNLSAGFLGGPAIGFMQDRFASSDLRHVSPAAYDRYRSDRENSFLLVFHAQGLDSSKVAVLDDNGAQFKKDLTALGRAHRYDANLVRLEKWWESAAPLAAQDRLPVSRAELHGSRMALRCTALIPVGMAIGFLLLILYFKSTGGYRQVHLQPEQAEALGHAVGVGDDA